MTNDQMEKMLQDIVAAQLGIDAAYTRDDFDQADRYADTLVKVIYVAAEKLREAGTIKRIRETNTNL